MLTPSSSNGVEPNRPGMVAIVDNGQRLRRDLLAQLAGEERRVPVDRAAVDRVEDSPSSDRAVRGSKITGAFCVAALRGFSRRRVRAAARRPTSSALSIPDALRDDVCQ